jgi:uracil permease
MRSYSVSRLKSYGGKNIFVGIQHMLNSFGAVVLVPLLTGLDVSVALLTAGIGTLFFHLVTKMKVPIFLGSSFAFIPVLSLVVGNEGVEYAQGGLIIAGAVYLVFSVLVYFVGVDRIQKLLPATVVGPVVVLIGLSLVGNGIDSIVGSNYSEGTVNAWTEYPWLALLVGLATLMTIWLLMLRAKGHLRFVVLLVGFGVGYGICLILKAFGLDVWDFSTIANADWFSLPFASGFSLPKFSWSAILIIAPVAIVTFMEHMGDMKTVGIITGKDIYKDPGVHRTLIGDGVATMIAGFFGGPANTTYPGDIILITSRHYDPRAVRVAAALVIVLAFFAKFMSVLQVEGPNMTAGPTPVIGAITLVGAGLFASYGVRNMIEGRVDFNNKKSLIVVSLILSVGIGINLSNLNGNIVITDNFSLNSMFVATIAGILANVLLPKDTTWTEDPKDRQLPIQDDIITVSIGIDK